MSECDCTITQGREGETGSFCIKCGTKVLEVHDRPCCECRHYQKSSPELIGLHPPVCIFHHMFVTRTMHVTYYINPAPPHRHGLCFEPKEESHAA